MEKKENKIVSFEEYKDKKEKQNKFKKDLSVIVKQPKEGQEAEKQKLRDYKIEQDKEARTRERNKRALIAALAGVVVIGGGGCAIASQNNKKEQAEYAKEIVERNNEENRNNEEMSKEDIIQQAINQMKIKEEVMSFITNLYIELYEQETGDTELTTKNIEIPDDRSCQNLAYLDEETNEIILHGGEPYTVEEKLKNEGVSYTVIDEVDAYRVRKNGKTIDTMVYKSGECYSAKEGLQYEQYDENYISILQKMGKVITTGLEYARKIESTQLSDTDIRILKNEFSEALKDFVENEKEVEIENLTAKQPTIEEDDLEL